MADAKVTDLTATTSPASTDVIYIVAGGIGKKITLANLYKIQAVGTENVLMGSLGSASQTAASRGNTTLGYLSGQSIVNGNSNTCFGNKAGASITGTGTTEAEGNASGALNSFFGSEAGGNVTTGTNNVCVGQKAGVSLTTGGNNIAIGKSCLAGPLTCFDSIFIGRACGESADHTGQFNIAIGSSACIYLSSTAEKNVYIGAGAGAATSGAKNTGSNNVGVGTDTLNVNTSGTQDVAIGFQALKANTTGSGNIAIGYQAGYAVVGGGNNIYIGGQAGYSHTASRCIFIGVGAGNSVPVSSQNVCVIGGSGNERIDDYYFGEGYSDSTPSGFTLHATGGSGTDIAGADAKIAGGQGTGTGASGKVVIQTAPTGTTGTSLNALVDAAQFDASKTSGDTRFLLYDVTAGTMKRVTLGAADSGGTGFKVLRVAN